VATTQDLISYYAGLLILQYLGKPKAYATIEALVTPVIMGTSSTQLVSLSAAPTSGTFTLSYNGNASASINWNDSYAAIQTTLQAVTGLSSVTVTGSLASQAITITMTGVTQPLMLVVASNALLSSGQAITIDVAASGDPAPLAVENGFNLTGSSTAVGAQLDILGKYVGVTRSGYSFSGVPITLGDSDFLSLITMAAIKNSSGSSLSTIQSLLHTFFPGKILVFDYANMTMSYLISSSVGSNNLVQLFVTEKILPKPMGVTLADTIYGPTITTFFGFRTYDVNTANNSPFNTYDVYNTGTPWLSYSNGIE